MDTLTIHYGIQGNGISFGLTYDDYKMLKKLFPHAQPSKGVFVEYDMKSNFKAYRPQLERYVFPTLVGMIDEKDLKQFKRIEFVKTPEMKVTYVIEPNALQNDPQIQSVSR
jgi:radical SAM superfamily enzyme with C-terminal helix-hairpin-helix motif